MRPLFNVAAQGEEAVAKEMKTADPFSLRQLSGLGPRRLAALQTAGCHDLLDLLNRFPKTYRRQQKMLAFPPQSLPEQDVLLDVQVLGAGAILRQKKLNMVRLPVLDAAGNRLTAIWFNQPYRKNQFVTGEQIWLLGKAEQKGNLRSILVKQTGKGPGSGGLQAVYSLPEGISPKLYRSWLQQALAAFPVLWTEPWPPEWEKFLPCSSRTAYQQIHFPQSEAELHAAQQRLLFDEMLMLQLLQAEPKAECGYTQAIPDKRLAAWRQSLPFQLTRAQQRVITEIRGDMLRPTPMRRFVQGDVGSGKTVVAAAALLQAVLNNHQAVLMAPTELLARQHARTLRQLLPPEIDVLLLTGKSSAGERRLALAAAAAGQPGVWVGTHALFAETLTFQNLSLVVIDEQHRFGVLQRQQLLAHRLPVPDCLSLSATPIPRSLAMLLYGDSSLSILDEQPPGRLPIKTVWLKEQARVEKLVDFCLAEMQQGRSVYWVCPSIETDEEAAAAMPSIEERAKLLSRRWPAKYWAVLHGGMKPAERFEVMNRFADGRLKGLLATTVIEVGVDQPTASVMVVEGADRFGLAQLHQLRGRVGRGQDQAYCALLSAPKLSGFAEKRLQALCDSQDGFYLAQMDLELRGPGEILGTDQSGFTDFLIFRWQIDETILQLVKDCAGKISGQAGLLRQEQWQWIRHCVTRLN
ncbi:MAG: ATP-dependent DNA helicase RecG [Negativicutes bacterium]|nr:ATP-dependent DNA helicase RecG [Negativicutes bacterium]